MSDNDYRIGIESVLNERFCVLRRKSRLAAEIGISVQQLDRLMNNSWKELRRPTIMKLHEWLLRIGRGGFSGTPFIVSNSLMRRLSERQSVLALLGNYPLNRDRTYVSSWDVRALSAFMSDLLRQMSGRVEIDQASVPPGRNGVLTLRLANRGRWKGKSTSGRYGCIVAIGSPHSCAATEHLLCSMLDDQKPHAAVDKERAKKLGFFWHDYDPTRSLPSAFTLTKAEAERRGQQPLEDGVNRLIVNGKSFDCKRTGKIYGAIAFREMASVIRITTVGLTGPATEAAARYLPKIEGNWLDKSREQKLTGIAVIESECGETKSDRGNDGDCRQLAFEKTRLVGRVEWV